MSAIRIRELQLTYAGIHELVLTRCRTSDNPDVTDLQCREVEIVDELKRLGAGPYPSIVRQVH
jgi:hypothetical protein